MDECKKWLELNSPALFLELYPPVQASEGEETKEQPKKKKKSVKFTGEKKIRVIKMKRGGKKIICNILGFELYGCDLTEVARLLSKRYGSGAAKILVEFKEIS